jgi:endonuclease YncB( thermonuclease family)
MLACVGWLSAACQPDQVKSLADNPIFSPSTTSPIHLTSTPRPSPTASHTQIPSSTPTLTPTPSITPSPTEDLSFFAIADCLPTDTAYQRGLVINVVDGDTIEVQLSDDITSTVRYIGVDAPENGYPFSEEARQANMNLVYQQRVVLVKDQSEVDRYQRVLRYVIVGDVFVNLQLVNAGFASAQNYPPDEACKDVFASAEEGARLAKIGMWVATPTPQPFAGQVIILSVNKRQEWADIQNVGDYPVDLNGWNLVSERGHQECPLSGILAAGEILRIWSMQPQGAGYSCGYTSPIWNNSEPDPAVLYNAQAIEVSRK